jgi:hypothetical protein
VSAGDNKAAFIQDRLANLATIHQGRIEADANQPARSGLTDPTDTEWTQVFTEENKKTERTRS